MKSWCYQLHPTVRTSHAAELTNWIACDLNTELQSSCINSSDIRNKDQTVVMIATGKGQKFIFLQRRF